MEDMRKELHRLMSDELKKGHSNVKITVEQNLGCTIETDGNFQGQTIAAAMLINAIAKKYSKEPMMILRFVETLLKITTAIECESQEQMNVMQWMMENGKKPGDNNER